MLGRRRFCGRWSGIKGRFGTKMTEEEEKKLLKELFKMIEEERDIEVALSKL